VELGAVPVRNQDFAARPTVNYNISPVSSDSNTPEILRLAREAADRPLARAGSLNVARPNVARPAEETADYKSPIIVPNSPKIPSPVSAPPPPLASPKPEILRLAREAADRPLARAGSLNVARAPKSSHMTAAQYDKYMTDFQKLIGTPKNGVPKPVINRTESTTQTPKIGREETPFLAREKITPIARQNTGRKQTPLSVPGGARRKK
jgi:hypothetical protein